MVNFQMSDNSPLLYKTQNPKVVNQLIPYDANYANAQKAKQLLTNAGRVAKGIGYGTAGLIGLDHHIRGNKLLEQAQLEKDPQKRRQLIEMAHNEYSKRTMSLAPMVLGGAAKAGAWGAGKLASLANKGVITPAYEQALKQAGINKIALNTMKAVPNAIKGVANTTKGILNTTGNIALNPATQMITPAIAEFLYRDSNITQEQRKQLEKEFGKTNNNKKTNTRYASNSNGTYYGGSTSGSTSNITKSSDSNSNAQTNANTLSGGDIYDILNNWKEQQEYMKPYREGLARYIQNYPELYRNAYARDMYLSGLGDLEGSSHMASMAGKYNPMTEQAKLLDLQKAMAGELQGADKDYQSLVGNLITAQRMGLNPNQVFANDKLLQLMNNNEIANAKLAQALQLAQARMALQQQLANQRISASYGNTALRNNASMDRAIFNNIFTENPKAGLDWIRSKGYNISDDILDSLVSNPYDEE